MKSALITGIYGQDGVYLANFLEKKGYKIYGISRSSSSRSHNSSYTVYPFDINDPLPLRNLIASLQPSEIYNLAALTNQPYLYSCPIQNFQTNGIGVLRILEAIYQTSPKTRLFQAGTSWLFGNSSTYPQNEETPFYPSSSYGVAKLYAHWSVVNYREAYGLYACNGILFNHESPRRSTHFLTRKITHGVVRVKKGLQKKITLGNLNTEKDWGFVEDFVNGMWLTLQQEKPEDFIFATNRLITIRRFVEIAFQYVGISLIWEGKGLDEKGINEKTGEVLVDISPKFYRKKIENRIVGDFTKAFQKLGWIPQTSVEDLVKLMIDSDLYELEINQPILY